MKKLLTTAIAFVLVAAGALAQNPNGNGNYNPCPSDKEYQFNIIATKDKSPEMLNNNGHRIFVDVTGKTRIYMTGDTDTVVNADGTGGYGETNGDLNCGTKFDVLDANGTDGQALLLVPCQSLLTNINPNVCFDVYATPLGKPPSNPQPNGPIIDVVCSWDANCIGCVLDGGSCAQGNIDKALIGHSGKPLVQDITSLFRATGCLDLGGVVGTCDTGDIRFRNEWIFNVPALQSYYWDYDANGNRIMQVRFCDVEGLTRPDGTPACGPNEVVAD